jgi:hypothetical protein
MEWVYAPQLQVMTGGRLVQVGAATECSSDHDAAREEQSLVELQPRKSPREEANESFETWVPLSCARITGVTCFFRVGASVSVRCSAAYRQRETSWMVDSR